MKITTSKKNTDEFDSIARDSYKLLVSPHRFPRYGLMRIVLINGLTNIVQAYTKDNYVINNNTQDIRMKIYQMINSIPDGYLDKVQLPLIIKYNLLVIGYSLGPSENRSIDELVDSIFLKGGFKNEHE